MIPTSEQRLFAKHPTEAFVEACPGAGKTRTILARLAHIAESLPPRQGVAVLSFTNKAIEEFKVRSADEGIGALLGHPGFIGTVDSFMRHFLFAPGDIEGSSTTPHVVDSWDSLDIEVRLGKNPFPGPGVSLELFDSETSTIDPTRINHNGLQRHVAGNRTAYEQVAKSYRQNLNRKGYYSTSDMRSVALRRIRQDDLGQALARALAGRFREIVVDEAQDSNPSDLEVLTWLRDNGIRVTMVCDMDQSIYSFRDGERTNLENFANTYAAENRLVLTGNFRSSPAICSLAASLRTKTEADIPSGSAREITNPIAIYPYESRSVSSNIGRWFVAHAESESVGIPRSELIVLAHSERTARRASGSFAGAGGKSKIERLARAVSDFWVGTTQHSKNSALSSVEKLLLDISDRREKGEPASRAVERLGLDGRLLRRQAFELVMRLPKTCPDTDVDRSAWIDSARHLMNELAVIIPPGQTIKTLLKKPGNAGWSLCLEQTSTSTGVRCSTIHNAKGGEYRGVCVVVPPDDSRAFTTKLFDAWLNRSDDEPKRVIYVGVTRAMHLAALAIPAAFLSKCIAMLESAGVPHMAYAPSSNVEGHV